MAIARMALLATAVITCAWFTLAAREVTSQSQISGLFKRPLAREPKQARAAEALLADARRLNPDQGFDMTRAAIEARKGDVRGALLVAEAVVRREPQNSAGWQLLEYLTRASDPALSRLAHARLRALAPPVPSAP